MRRGDALGIHGQLRSGYIPSKFAGHSPTNQHRNPLAAGLSAGHQRSLYAELVTVTK